MSSAPYFPFYPSDYLADTGHLSTEQHGAYLLLLFASWPRGGRLPNDPKKLARIARISPRRWHLIAPDVLDFFVEDGDEIVSERLAKESQKADSKRQLRISCGRLGGKRKALKSGETALAKAKQKPSKSPSIFQNQNQKEEKASPKKTILPDGFPDAKARKMAADYWKSRNREYLSDRMQTNIDKFRAHHSTKATQALSWSGQWTTWYTNAVAFEEQAGIPETRQIGSAKPEPRPYDHIQNFYSPLQRDDTRADVQRGLIDQWQKTGKWGSDRFTPPDDPKTRLRPDVLAEFGIGQAKLKIGDG